MRLRMGLVAAGLAAVLLLGATPANAGGGCHGATFSDEEGTTVRLLEACFVPMVTRVGVGDQVTWENPSGEKHTVTGVANSWGNYDALGMNGSVSYVFDKPGVFPYFCLFHPGMVGAVVVGDGLPAAASTADRGVKAVSAQAPGDPGSEDTPASPDSDDGGSDIPLIAGIALALAVAGA